MQSSGDVNQAAGYKRQEVFGEAGAGKIIRTLTGMIREQGSSDELFFLEELRVDKTSFQLLENLSEI